MADVLQEITYFGTEKMEQRGIKNPAITIGNTGGPSQSYILNGLNTATTYNWRIKCGNSGSWEYGPDFTTLNCNITSSIAITDASCDNTMNGGAALTISGGATPYTFAWDNGDTTQNLNGVLSGTYTVIIVDNLGCTDTATATIGIIGGSSIQQNISDFLPNPVTAYNQWSYDTLQMINTGCEVRVRPEFEVSCSAGNIQQGDLTIKWTIPGQAGGINIPYTINANGNAEGFWSQIAGDSTGYLLSYSGNYTLIIKVKFSNPPGTAQYGTYTAYWETFEVDNLGNKIGSLSPTDTVSLSFIDYCATFSIDSISSDSTSCSGGNNGTAEVITINSGSGNYAYGWSNGATTNPATNLSAGTYYVTVNDTTYGCSDTDTIIINDGSGSSTILDSIIWTNISCNGSTNGSAEVIINTGGGGGSFTGSYCSSVPIYNQYTTIEFIRLIGDSDTISNNTIGVCDTYEDYTTMSTNLTVGQSYSMRVNLGWCTQNFGWDDAAKIFIDWNIDGDFDDPDEEVHIIGPNLTPSTNTFTFSVPTSALSGTTRMRVVAQNQSYNNPSTMAFGPCDSTVWFGATEDYSLVINAPSISATYLWNNGDTTSITAGLATGSYWCTVSDSNNCSSITDTILITEPSAITVSSSTTNVSCNGGNDGTATLTLSGGTGTLSADWGTTNPNALSAGAHIFNISDSNNCLLPDSVTITEPSAITSSFTTIDVDCYGNNTGSATVIFNGGVIGSAPGDTNYILSWDTLLYILPFPYTTFTTPIGVPAGIYPYGVTDANGCTHFDIITIYQPSAISVTATTTVVSCNGGNDGTAILTLGGGTGTLSPNWGAANPNALSAGTHIFTVSDSNNCLLTDSVIIAEPSAISVTTITTVVSCNGGNDGTAILTLGGGNRNTVPLIGELQTLMLYQLEHIYLQFLIQIIVYSLTLYLSQNLAQ